MELNLRDVLSAQASLRDLSGSEDFRHVHFGELVERPYERAQSPLLNDEDRLFIESEKEKTPGVHHAVYVDGFFCPEISNVPPEWTVGDEAPVEVDLAPFHKKKQWDVFERINRSDCSVVTRFLGEGEGVYNVLWINKQPRNACAHRFDLQVASGAKTTICFRFLSRGSVKSFNNLSLMGRLEKGASLVFEQMFFNGGDYVVQNSRFIQESESDLRVRQFSMGSPVLRSAVYSALVGKGARVDVKGGYAHRGKAMSDFFLYLCHHAEETLSRQLYRGILKEQGVVSINGEVYVAPEAFLTDSAQLMKTLVLSSEGKVYYRPQLDIHCDDVKCAHGAALGGLNPEEVFYMKTRGISEENAHRQLALGTVLEVVKEFSSESQKKVESYLEKQYFL